MTATSHPFAGAKSARKPPLTPLQRYQAVLSGAPIDFVPRIPILMQFAAEFIGSNYRAFASDYRVLAEANIRCAEHFGLDQLSGISDPYRETAGFGAPIRFHENAVPECLKRPVPDLSILPSLSVPDPWQAPRMRDRMEAIRLYRELTGDHYSVMGWVEGPGALAGDLRGVEDFLMDLIEEPEACSVLLHLCAETAIRFAREQIKLGADTIGVGDALCSQISAALFGGLIWPHQKRVIETIKAEGVFVRLHICGQTRHLWPWLKQLPIDILDCDHMVDMAAARQTFPPTVVLAGNLDPVADLRFGSLDTIPDKVRVCQHQAGSRFMVCAGCEIPSATPSDNLLALCEPLPPA